MRRFFRDWKIQTKITLMAVVLVLLPILIISALALGRFTHALQRAAEADLEHILQDVVSMCRIEQGSLRSRAASSLDMAQSMLKDRGRYLREDRAVTVVFKAVDHETREVRRVELPLLETGDSPITGNSGLVEEIQRLLGGECTVYQRVDEGGLLAISTTVPDRGGPGAPGDYISLTSPLVDAILRGQTYLEQTFKGDRWETRAFGPLRDEGQRIVGALCVKTRDQPIDALKKAIARIRVGRTGYAFVVDTKGNIILHPTKEGRNIASLPNPAESAVISKIIQEGSLLRERQVGTIRYPWVNVELGEKRPRRKITKYVYFKDWDWIIGAGSYEQEIYHAVGRTRLFIYLVSGAIVSAAVFLAVLLSRLLTRPILNLTEITARMARGDFSHQADTSSRDEVGLLGRSFNEMARQILDKTEKLQEIVADRTARLTESEARYQRLFEGSKDGIYISTVEGKFLDVNQSAVELFGYRDKEDLLSIDIPRDLYVNPEDREKMKKEIERHGYVKDFEQRLKKKDGTEVFVLITSNLVRDAQGRPVAYEGIMRDITERKRLDAELKKTQAFLVQTAKTRALGDLVAGVAHELNNPLMASDTILHVISENLHKGCPNQTRLELVQECNRRMAKIINHLREFSRQAETVFEPLDIRLPLENALMIVGQQLLNQNISTEKDLAPNLPVILGDSNQLEQVFLNLISNARDAMQDQDEPRRLIIKTRLIEKETEQEVEVLIGDTGRGIPEEIIDKIFVPFFTTKDVGKGTGLGLAICYGIIENHGGRIEVDSRQDRGTNFRVYLPVPKGDENGKKNPGS
ncbi:MAG: Cache 3/Cache 2 fusion domain-containing protein [Deltaproteobacteria bacterium]|nr:Cache 3/Cache 2 fusion domain-containing protein [Deltaproteobacteria bacterium]